MNVPFQQCAIKRTVALNHWKTVYCKIERGVYWQKTVKSAVHFTVLRWLASRIYVSYICTRKGSISASSHFLSSSAETTFFLCPFNALGIFITPKKRTMSTASKATANKAAAQIGTSASDAPTAPLRKGVRSRVLKTEHIAWQDAKWLQNENLKAISEDGLQRLKNSIVSNDFVMPFNVWQDEDEVVWILDGHHREKALRSLVAEGVPVPAMLPATFIEAETKQDAAKLVLIYSSIYAKITNEGLSDFLQMFEIPLEEFSDEIDIPEFSMPRFEQLFEPDYDLDEATEDSEEEEVVTSADAFTEILINEGDIFKLNGHLLYCGNGMETEVWPALLRHISEDGAKARMVLTDPPYNVKANHIGNLGTVRHADFVEAAGEMSDEEFSDYLYKLMEVSKAVTVDGALHYIFMDFRHAWHMTEASRRAYGSVEPKQLCVWNKDVGGMGSFYRSKHEFCFIFKNGKEKHKSNVNLGDRVRYNVWDYPAGNSMRNPDKAELKSHPTPKNVQMCKDAILDVTDRNDIIIDFYLGSGTTLIAADMSNRVCAGSEILPEYCQHIIYRYLQHSRKVGQAVEFEHINGNITAEAILETVKPKA